MTGTLAFTSIVGQEELKLALLLAAINPAVGGVVLRGEKGTAKSTTARALAGLLPEQSVIKGCLYGCDPETDKWWCQECRTRENPHETSKRKVPFVELPLNATEEMVTGGMDISATLKRGRVVFKPGLLAACNRGILYADEINLVDRDVVSLLLTAMSSGWNRVERDGISLCHPSRFVLIGSMNPEEGELSPQLLDRIGLCVEVKSSKDIDERVALLRLHEGIERNEKKAHFQQEEDKRLGEKLSQAIRRLPNVRIGADLRHFIANLAQEHGVSGHRAELVLEAASRALCALYGQKSVKLEHVLKVAPLVLFHRERKRGKSRANPLRHKTPDRQRSQKEKGEPSAKEQRPKDRKERGKKENPSSKTSTERKGQEGLRDSSKSSGTKSDASETVFKVGQHFLVRKIEPKRDKLIRTSHGRRAPSLMKGTRGRASGYLPIGTSGDISIYATIKAAAPFQKYRAATKSRDVAVAIEPQDLRFKKRRGRVSCLVVFVVDASGSMGANARMIASKGAIMSLLLDAYRLRDKVAMVSFRGKKATVELPPTSSVELAGKYLSRLATGGRTPLSAGLIKAYWLVNSALRKDPLLKPLIILITDGRANQTLSEGVGPVAEMDAIAFLLARDKRTKFVVVDTEDRSGLQLGLPRRLADSLGAAYYHLEELKSDHLVSMVKEHT